MQSVDPLALPRQPKVAVVLHTMIAPVRMVNGQRARRRLRLSHLSALRLTQQRQKVLERINITLDIQRCFLSIVFDR